MDRTSTANRPVRPDDLRALRAEAGLTQRQLAGRAGCSAAWIMSAEGGYVPRNSAVLARVLEVLDAATKNDDPALTGEAVKDAEAPARGTA